MSMLLTLSAVALMLEDEPQRRAIFSYSDYPPEAMRRGEEGTVQAKLRISKEGAVIGCEIIRSATPILDEATCQMLTERARFTPAKDQNGNPIEDVYTTPPIRWVLAGKDKKKRGIQTTRM